MTRTNTDAPTHAFTHKDSRKEDMHDAISGWVDALADDVQDARTTDHFQNYLDVMSSFHDYSYRNTLLIKMQCPNATKVAGYNTWRNEFDRHVKEGEEAIWIWAPNVKPACPECGNSEWYHNNVANCDYDDTDPDEWPRDVVSYRTVPVYDVSQTEGEPLPELETSAHGDATDLKPAVLDAARNHDDIPRVEIISESNWSHGTANGTSHKLSGAIKVKDRENTADLTRTVIHETAHSILHTGDLTDAERDKRELEAESVAYVVCRHFGLDADNSKFYLATWAGENPDAIRERLHRISNSAQGIIETIESHLPEDADVERNAAPQPA